MADYQLTATDAGVIRTVDQAWIPDDPANRDWMDYQTWLDQGHIPDPYVPPPDPGSPPPDPNVRLDAGVNGAVNAWNSSPASAKEVVSPTVDNRLARLEETLKGMCQGQGLSGGVTFV